MPNNSSEVGASTLTGVACGVTRKPVSTRVRQAFQSSLARPASRESRAVRFARLLRSYLPNFRKRDCRRERQARHLTKPPQ
jgi:hypothetical protein